MQSASQQTENEFASPHEDSARPSAAHLQLISQQLDLPVREYRSLRLRHYVTAYRRFLVHGGFCALYILSLVVFCLLGFLTTLTCALVTASMLVLASGFYCFYSHAEDKRNAMQTCVLPVSAALMLLSLTIFYLVPESGILTIVFAFMAHGYCMYHVNQKKLLTLCAVSIVAFCAIVLLHYLHDLEYIVLRSEIAQAFVLTVCLPAFCLLVGRVHRLNSALWRASIKIRSIEEHARRDPSLGCYNRRFVLAALDEQKRNADLSGVPLCLAVFDLDHFKRVNDEIGHLAGDEVLRTFVLLAQKNIRQSDIFGRYGGEEFLLICPNSSLLAAMNMTERIREQTELHDWGKAGKVTISVGITQYIPGESTKDLFARTDTAMYLAKRGGRNQVIAQDPPLDLWGAPLH